MGDIYWGVGGCWTYEKREGGEQNLREKLHLVGEEFIYVDNWKGNGRAAQAHKKGCITTTVEQPKA